MAPLLYRMDISPIRDSRDEYAEKKVKLAVKDHEEEVEVAIPLKIVLLGNSGVGKTSLIEGRNIDSIPPPATIGASFVTFDVNIDKNEESIRFQVWDTAGQERFRCMVPMYMRNASAAIIVFDVTNRESFEDVSKWEKELRRCCSTGDPSIILVGNKSDLSHKRCIARGEAINKANEIRATYIEMSACQNQFEELLNHISLNINPSSLTRPSSSTVILTSSSSLYHTKSSFSCCSLI